MSIMGLTHYTEDHTTPGFVHAFAVEDCEFCGGNCEAPNAIGILLSDAVRFNLKRLDRRLPKPFFSEDVEMCICEACMPR